MTNFWTFVDDELPPMYTWVICIDMKYHRPDDDTLLARRIPGREGGWIWCFKNKRLFLITHWRKPQYTF